MSFNNSISLQKLQKIGYQRLLLLIALNVIPLIGVLYWQWDIFTVILLFWLENAVIGVFNCTKILACRGSKNNKGKAIKWYSNLGLAIFFLVHYGFFTSAHGMIVLKIFEQDFTGEPWDVWNWVYQWFQNTEGVLWLAVIAMIAYWLFDFIQFWLKERKDKEAGKQMMEPYSRIVIAHLVLLFGAIIVMKFGFELAIVILLVLIKTFINYHDLVKKQTNVIN